MPETLYLKKSLIELLEIAKSTGVIHAWTVDRRFIVFHTDTAQFSVLAVEAGSFLRHMILDAGITRALQTSVDVQQVSPTDAGEIIDRD